MASLMNLLNRFRTYPLILCGNKHLRKPCQDVDLSKIQTDEFKRMLRRMISTMRINGGVGLAAPQVGLNLNVFMYEVQERSAKQIIASHKADLDVIPLPLTICINPKVKYLGKATKLSHESCLSVPDYNAKVHRHLNVQLDYYDLEGKRKSIKSNNPFHSRIIQHEYDHLNGELFIDKMDSLTFCKESEYEGYV